MSLLITIPGVGRFKPLKAGKIHLRCRRSKQTRSNMDRYEHDLPNSAVLVSNYCDRCDTGGEFEDIAYFTIEGTELLP